MDIFDMNEEKLAQLHATFTATEIAQQPSMWQKTAELVQSKQAELKSFLDKALVGQEYNIVLSGAGTSEFVGNALAPALNPVCNYNVRSCATTDIVTNPVAYLSPNKPTLLVSFGRSGDSPESLGAIEAADAVCNNLSHLFITCNAKGALAQAAASRSNCFALNLAPQTHDKSFAMTSSFSSMYAAAWCAFNLDRLDEVLHSLSVVEAASQKTIETGWHQVEKIQKEFDFSRIVYLGTAALKGIAQESALKMLELTAGEVETMFDSALGFRHGPKSIVNNQTLTVLYLSDNPFERRYELDLLREMSTQAKQNKICAVINRPCPEAKELAHFVIELSAQSDLSDVYLGLGYIVYAQILALLTSLAHNITPDNPCPTGEVNRVVQGVTIYPWEG